jgi:hypothetical protein
LRNNAYPFDWLKIKDMDTINDMIENEFEGLFNKDNFVLKSVSEKFPLDTDRDKNDPSYIYINNNIEFCHDFNHDFNTSYKNFIEKYKSRIYRLYELIHSDKHIHFIRDEWKYNNNLPEKIEKFQDIIKSINPYCKYTTSIIINTKKPLDIDIKNTNIIFDINKLGDWTRSNIDWQYIFDTENMPNQKINNKNFLI